MDTKNEMWQLIPYDHNAELEVIELPPTMTASYAQIVEEVEGQGFEVHNKVQVTEADALPGDECVAIIRKLNADV